MKDRFMGSPMRLGRVIREVRGHRSQEDFARAHRISKSALIRYELDRRAPPYGFLESLVQNEQVDPRRFFDSSVPIARAARAPAAAAQSPVLSPAEILDLAAFGASVLRQQAATREVVEARAALPQSVLGRYAGGK